MDDGGGSGRCQTPAAVLAALERLGGDSDTLGVWGADETELPGVFAGVKEVGGIALIEHFVRLGDERVKPASNPDHGPAQNAEIRRDAKFFGG